MKKLIEFKVGSVGRRMVDGVEKYIATYRNVVKNGQWEQAIVNNDESGKMYFYDNYSCKRVYIS